MAASSDSGRGAFGPDAFDDYSSPKLSQPWAPHDYQRRAVKMLVQQGAAGLFLDPGLGKSSISLAAFKILKAKGLAKRMLLVAPLRPCYSVWPAEIDKWVDFHTLSYTILHGKDKEEHLHLDRDIFIINPEGLAWLIGKHPGFVTGCDTLLIDESTLFKNSQSKRFKLLKPFMGGFSRRWILTGTPVPNGLMDLFAQIYILDLGRALGRFITHYRMEFFDQHPYNQYEWIAKRDSFEKITERIRPLILRLSAEELLNMPELITINVPVQLPAGAMKIYREVEEDFITQLGDEELTAANAAVAGGKCRQIANGAVYDQDRVVHPIHDTKLEALSNILGELEGHPVLVLYEFQHDADRIQKAYPGARNLSGLSGARADQLVREFNAGGVPILLGHPASMGHGLNLQGACHHVIWFGIPWNLEHYDQAIARVYRQGQTSEHVLVYHLISIATLDVKVAQVLTSKDRSQRALLGALAS